MGLTQQDALCVIILRFRECVPIVVAKATCFIVFHCTSLCKNRPTMLNRPTKFIAQMGNIHEVQASWLQASGSSNIFTPLSSICKASQVSTRSPQVLFSPPRQGRQGSPKSGLWAGETLQKVWGSRRFHRRAGRRFHRHVGGVPLVASCY